MNVEAGGNGSLRLDGTAGNTENELPENVRENGLTDRFTLTLKIKKSESTK